MTKNFNIFRFIVGSILIAIGIYFLVGGFKMQLLGVNKVEYISSIFYIIGTAIIWLGKSIFSNYKNALCNANRRKK